jgi:hypothetical protein
MNTDFHRFLNAEPGSFLLFHLCLKFAPLPRPSPLPIAALPSMSLIPFAPFICLNLWPKDCS